MTVPDFFQLLLTDIEDIQAKLPSTFDSNSRNFKPSEEFLNHLKQFEKVTNHLLDNIESRYFTAPDVDILVKIANNAGSAIVSIWRMEPVDEKYRLFEAALKDFLDNIREYIENHNDE